MHRSVQTARVCARICTDSACVCVCVCVGGPPPAILSADLNSAPAGHSCQVFFETPSDIYEGAFGLVTGMELRARGIDSDLSDAGVTLHEGKTSVSQRRTSPFLSNARAQLH